MEFLSQYTQIGVFIVFGILFSCISLGLSWLLRARGNDPLFNTTYECGPEPEGSAWGKINVRFYIFALLFVLFDVEILFLYPWAIAYRKLGVFGFIEMVIFISVLFLGLVYAWRKGALEWE